MKGTIVEKKGSNIIVLTEKGDFVKRKFNKEAQIGQEVTIKSFDYRKVVSYAAVLLLIFVIGFNNYTVYAQPYGYATIDFEDSYELVYNKKFQIIEVNDINGSGDTDLEQLNEQLKGVDLEDAIGIITKNASEAGKLNDNTLVVTYTAGNEETEKAIKNEIVQNIQDDTELHVISVTKEQHNIAKESQDRHSVEILKNKLIENGVPEEEVTELNEPRDLAQRLSELNKRKNDDKSNKNNEMKNQESEKNKNSNNEKDKEEDKEQNNQQEQESEKNKNGNSNEEKSNNRNDEEKNNKNDNTKENNEKNNGRSNKKDNGKGKGNR